MTTQPPPQYPPYAQYPPPQPPAKKRRKWPWIAGGVVAFLMILGAISNNGQSNNGNTNTASGAAPASQSTGAAPASEAAPAAPTTPAGPASTITKDGTFLVGSDIVPGTYRSDGGDSCYWERDKDLEGNVGSIIANSNADGQQVVTILPTDKAFQTQGCGSWALIPS